MEDKAFKFVKIYSTVSIMIHLLQQLGYESFLDRDLKFY